ncbi:YeeE/YedE family protein [Thauera sp. JM12B12]|uniref:YeeE/YedE family protein n=1 Tax=Thauera sp. JM12B12 TaxID=3142262 RepID=UPI0031F34D48
MRWLNRTFLISGGLAGVLAVTLAAGVRQGLLALLGIGFGAVLQGARFGFTTGWRDFIERRDPQGLWAQMLLMVLAAVFTLPLIAGSGGELVGAVAPLTISLVLGAFLFGAAMQLADGCGSGTLYKAGAGSPLSFVVLPTFAFGSFLGASHQPAWIALGGLPAVDLLAFGWPTALTLTVAACALVALAAGRAARGGRARVASSAPQAVARDLVRAGTASFVAAAPAAAPAMRGWARRWWLGAALLAVLYLLHLLVAGQPWGIVYGMGVWGAKLVGALGWDLSGDAFWGVAPHAQRLVEPVLADVTSVTNIGLIYGAIAASRWNGPAEFNLPSGRRLAAAAIAGLVMGYSARMAFGCNVGAYLGGIASASLHGWVWFALAFAGSIFGVRIRRRIGG